MTGSIKMNNSYYRRYFGDRIIETELGAVSKSIRILKKDEIKKAYG